MNRVDPWPDLDHDPLMLLIDNYQPIYRKVLDLCRETNENIRVRRLYGYLREGFRSEIIYGDKANLVHVAGLFRTLHRMPLPDEVRYFVQLANHYHKLGLEEPKRAD